MSDRVKKMEAMAKMEEDYAVDYDKTWKVSATSP